MRVWKITHDIREYPPLFCKTIGDVKWAIDVLMGYNDDETRLDDLIIPDINFEIVEMTSEEFEALEGFEP